MLPIILSFEITQATENDQVFDKLTEATARLNKFIASYEVRFFKRFVTLKH